MYKVNLIKYQILIFILSFIIFYFNFFELFQKSNIEKQIANKKVLLNEKFEYLNIDEFIKLNVNPNVNLGWGMPGKYQFSPNILDDNNSDLNKFKAIKGEFKGKEGFGGISGDDIVKIINTNKKSTIEKFQNKNWLSLEYRLPILKTNDRELLSKYIFNDKDNKKDSLNPKKNYNVYFSRNEIYAFADSLALKVNKNYELSWKVKLDENFYLSEEKTIIGQIHNMDNYKYYNESDDRTFGNPFLVFSVQILDGEPIWNIFANRLDNKVEKIFTSNIHLERGKVYEFKVRLKMSSRKDGYIKVWVNDDLISDTNNVNTHLSTIPTKEGDIVFKNGYFKLGMYQPGWNKTIRIAWENIPYEYDHFEDFKFVEKKIWLTDVSVLEF